MPIKTNLSVSPYFDDYDQEKDHAKILFQPGVAVQARELNQLQTLLQKQVERMGDNIFKRGTIIDGCNFSFYNKYQYVKLLDNSQEDGPADPAAYVGLFAKNAANLQSYIMNYAEGFEASTPNLKTLYVNYRNSGNTYNINSYSASDLLTIYSPDDKMFKITINNGGIAFTNSDLVVFAPALTVNVSTGTFSAGAYLKQPSTGANVYIISSDAVAGTNDVILKVRPIDADMVNSSVNSTAWTIDRTESVDDGASATGIVSRIHGQGAVAFLKTSGTGKITSMTVTEGGTGYDIVPHVTVQSHLNSSGLAALDLTGRNYFTKVSVSGGGDAVGNGYAFGVSDGVIYQKGYFLRVGPQVVIVNNYSSSPNNVVVGFDSDEEIIDADIDTSLLDNALGTENYTAPGADRLRLTPTLVVNTTANARSNDEFFIIAEWNDGNPYKQHQVTTYDQVGDEMARRMFDHAGDFVLDTFLVTTDSVANVQNEGSVYTAVVDPGTAYVSGYKTHTNRNYRVDVRKGLDTQLNGSYRTSINYDTYVRINEAGGLFQFSTGDTVNLYDTAKDFISNTSLVVAGNTDAVGNLLGTARARSMILESGKPGDAGAVYRLYLFDIDMNAGKNFRSVKSLHYPGTYEGIADAVLELDGTTSTNIAVVKGRVNDGLIFRSGVESIKNSNVTSYIYRTIDQTEATANTGLLVKTIAADPDEFFPYGVGAALSNSQMQELYVVPIEADLIEYTAATGTVTANSTIANIVGSATTFITDFEAGDFVYVSNTGSNDTKRVLQVVNNTFMVVDSNCSFDDAAAEIRRTFPVNVPVPFGDRSGLSANLDATGDILTLNYGMTMTGSTDTDTAIGVNIIRQDVTSTAKVGNRNQMVQLRLANNAATNSGPWCIGVPDIFRLRGVWVGDASVNTTHYPEVTRDFYIDHNQNANYYDLGYLYVRPKSAIQLSTSEYLLVSFDYCTSTEGGYYDAVSYRGTANAELIANTDSANLASLTTALSSFEIPELYTFNGGYYDPIGCFDFRPYVANTVAPTTSAATAPVNPDYTKSFGNTADPANDKKFPLPDSVITSDMEQYLGRTDAVIMGHDGHVAVLRGQPSADPSKRLVPNIPKDSMHLQTIVVPPYPDVAKNLNDQVAELISTRMVNEVASTSRLVNHQVRPIRDSHLSELTGQPLGFSMRDIGKLARRVTNLEYYQSLSILETSITTKIIPSSIDPSLNRFKFGFFADDYATWIHNDTRNPQYAADIEPFDIENQLTANSIPQLASNLLVPPKFPWKIKHFIQQLSAPYIDQEIIDQENATENPPECDLEPIAGTDETVAQVNAIVYDWSALRRVSQNESRADVQLSTLSGNVVVYYHAFQDPLLQIYQNGSLRESTVNAVALTDSDLLYLTSNAYTEDFFHAASHDLWWAPTRWGDFYADANGYVQWSGKIEFTHDPSAGRDYHVYIKLPYGSENGDSFQWMMIYPIDRSVYSNYVVDPCLDATPTIYSGSMLISSQLNVGGTTQTNQFYDYIQMECTGLKPETIHRFYLDGTENSDSVKQDGKNLGEDIISNDMGWINAYYHVSNVWYNKVDSVVIPDFPDNNHEYESAGYHAEAELTLPYALFELKTENSSCYALVPIAMPDRIL